MTKTKYISWNNEYQISIIYSLMIHTISKSYKTNWCKDKMLLNTINIIEHIIYLYGTNFKTVELSEIYLKSTHVCFSLLTLNTNKYSSG